VRDHLAAPKSERDILAERLTRRRRTLALGLVLELPFRTAQAWRRDHDPLTVRAAIRETLLAHGLTWSLYEAQITRYRRGLSEIPSTTSADAAFGAVAFREAAHWSAASFVVSVGQEYTRTRSGRAALRRARRLGLTYGVMFGLMFGAQRLSDHRLRRDIDARGPEDGERLADDGARSDDDLPGDLRDDLGLEELTWTDPSFDGATGAEEKMVAQPAPPRS
jgi:hypothetical protein